MNTSPHLCSYIISLHVYAGVFPPPQLPEFLALLKNVRSLAFRPAPEPLDAFQAHIFPSITHLNLRRINGLQFSILRMPNLQSLTLTTVTSMNDDPFPVDFPLHSLRSLHLIDYNSDEITNNTGLLQFLRHSTRGLASCRIQPTVYFPDHIFKLQDLELVISRDQRLLEVLHVGPVECMSSPRLEIVNLAHFIASSDAL